jgi:hypothetical protein
MRWAEHATSMREMRNEYKMVGKSEGKRPLGRPKRRWQNNNGMYLREIEWEGVNWVNLDQDRDQLRAFVYMVLNLRVP